MGSPENDDDTVAEFSSPPCFLHELEPAFVVPTTHGEVTGWRKTERQRLIADRLGTSADQRQNNSAKIASALDTYIGNPEGLTISTYWPFRGEPDLRKWMESVTRRGGQCALPVVIERGQPLIFRKWKAGDPLVRGVWNIPIPAEGPAINPDIVIAPVVGFDPHCYRLGYGGGFFDRTLAAMSMKPRIVGVGYESAFIPTIHPQPYDIPMDAVITEQQIHSPIKDPDVAQPKA